MSIQIEAKFDRTLTDLYERISTPTGRRALMMGLGVTAEQQLRAWWIRRDAEDPNKMGWPRQHFWARIAKRTAFDPSKTTESSATVTVADPALAAKINGATIHPTPPRRFLAIPMRGEAYGVLPRSQIIPGLFVFRSAATNGAYLVRRSDAAKGSANLEFFYRLVPSVKVPKDPKALPPLEQLGQALTETASDFFRRRGPTGAIPATGGAN